MSPKYEISRDAEEDWRNIVLFTLDKYGEKQVQKYTGALIECLDELAKSKGPFKIMTISNHEVLIKPCQKHYIFALNRPDKPLLIIAVLHERMDLIKRLKHRLG